MGKHESAAAVSDLLADGTWALAENKRVCSRAHRLRDECCELVLTYRYHRFRAIRGGSTGDSENVRQRITDLVNKLAETPKVFASYAVTAEPCAMCGGRDDAGRVEYEIMFSSVSLRLDRDCYAIWHDIWLARMNGHN